MFFFIREVAQSGGKGTRCASAVAGRPPPSMPSQAQDCLLSAAHEPLVVGRGTGFGVLTIAWLPGVGSRTTYDTKGGPSALTSLCPCKSRRSATTTVALPWCLGRRVNVGDIVMVSWLIVLSGDGHGDPLSLCQMDGHGVLGYGRCVRCDTCCVRGDCRDDVSSAHRWRRPCHSWRPTLCCRGGLLLPHKALSSVLLFHPEAVMLHGVVTWNPRSTVNPELAIF